jgi:hypothetical protein
MLKQKLSVEVTFTEPSLATSSGNPELHEEFQASRSKDAAKQEEEASTLPKEDVVEKTSTVFHRDDKGIFVYDYTWKGFFKEVIGFFCELGEFKALSKWTYKRAVDGTLYVFPRRIYVMREGKVLAQPEGSTQRPLRCRTMQGDRVALARSEHVDPGSTCSFDIVLLESSNQKSAWREVNLDLVKRCLDHGELWGYSQWRGGGNGRFTWKTLS